MSDPTTKRFTQLPDPIDPAEMITSTDGDPVPEEKDDYWREVEWMLRTTGFG